MNDLERDRRINDIVLCALGFDGEQQDAYIERVCNGDERLRADVRASLASEETLSGFLDRPVVVDLKLESEDDPTAPRHIGGFRLLRPLGEGGMGTVYLAQQDRPIRRQVALKLLRLGYLHSGAALRFHAEGQALARMSHPHVAQVYEVGAERGRPYIVLEHVEGERIDRFCDRHQLTIDRRLEIFLAVCEGVQHAHQKGIIHRDIKPSNVLVAGTADKPIPKLIDFGIAKSVAQPLIDETFATGDGLVGTPAYLSPEMIDGAEVDVRSDVYNLGILLYQLLVGDLPYVAGSGQLLDLLRQIKEQPLTPPAQFLDTRDDQQVSRVAELRRTTRTALTRGLQGDLSWILAKATAKEAQQRYPSALALAADIGRFQRHEMVVAGPPSVAYRARKFIRRHKVSVAAAALVLLALAGGLVATTLEARRAQRQAELASAALDLMTDVFMSSTSGPRGSSQTVEDLLRQGTGAARRRLADQPLARAQLLGVLGSVYAYLARYDDAESLFDEALEIRMREQGDEHPEVAVASWHRARIHRVRGENDSAERLALRAIAVGEGADVEPSQIAAMHRELGVIHLAKGRFSEARSVFERALELAEPILADDDSELASLIEDLGRVHHHLGNLGEAERLARRVVSLRSAALLANDRRQAIAASRLGEVLTAQGRLAEAEPELLRAVAIASETLGPEHDDVGAYLYHLAVLRARQDRFQEADDLYHQSLEIKKRVHGPEHYDIALLYNNLGALRWRQGLYAEAAPYYRQALELKTKTLGADHVSTALTMSNLGEVWWKMGRLDDAEAILRQALEIQNEAVGKDHPDRSYPLHALAVISRQRGRLAEAEALFAEVFALRAQFASHGDPDFRDTRVEYAALLETLGRADEAREILASPASAQ